MYEWVDHTAELELRIESATPAEVFEEALFAYKDVERVVAIVERAGLARRVAQLRPLGVVKG